VSICGQNPELQFGFRASDFTTAAQFKSISSTTCTVTGPSKPDSNNGESLFQCFQVAKVMRPVGLGLPAKSHSGHLAKGAP
jgi:hypothetical protein